VHVSLLDVAKALPSSLSGQVSSAKRCCTASPVSRCQARPRSERSQPTPTAPGPKRSQNSSDLSSSGAIWRSVRRVLSSPASASSTSTQLIPPPNSQVSAKLLGGSHAVTVPPALPLI